MAVQVQKGVAAPRRAASVLAARADWLVKSLRSLVNEMVCFT